MNTDPKSKLVYSLDLPPGQSEWPVVSDDVLCIFLDLLCRLLTPIGEYRKHNIDLQQRPRKPKRLHVPEPGSDHVSPVIATGILQDITIGFNSTVRCLEAAAGYSQVAGVETTDSEEETSALDSDADGFLAAVFVCRSDLPPALLKSLPLLVASASGELTELQKPRLVGLPLHAQAKLADALNQPRVGLVGLRQRVKGAESLLDLVRQHTAVLTVPWIRNNEYIAVNIKETHILPNKKHGRPTHGFVTGSAPRGTKPDVL